MRKTLVMMSAIMTVNASNCKSLTDISVIKEIGSIRIDSLMTEISVCGRTLKTNKYINPNKLDKKAQRSILHIISYHRKKIHIIKKRNKKEIKRENNE